MIAEKTRARGRDRRPGSPTTHAASSIYSRHANKLIAQLKRLRRSEGIPPLCPECGFPLVSVIGAPLLVCPKCGAVYELRPVKLENSDMGEGEGRGSERLYWTSSPLPPNDPERGFEP